jgi:redox-sensitive bicupin YhaK (pirin superfamily)
MPIEHQLGARARDLGGGFNVRRLLPSASKPSVGPFVFFDHFGPLTTHPGDNHDVRPHPHIGLATVSYLFDGAMLHRDSLGSVQRIEPGAINWMTAGRGIVHSERRPPDLRSIAYTTHGLQLWAALPVEFEETDPRFRHTPAEAMPAFSHAGARVRVLIGEAFGHRSPVETFAATLYLDVDAQEGATLELSPRNGAQMLERGVYSVDNPLTIDGVAVPAFTMAVLAPDATSQVVAPKGARFVVVGGEPLDGPRFIWWNFVSSRKDRIEQAKRDWSEQRIGHIPGEVEWVPLP